MIQNKYRLTVSNLQSIMVYLVIIPNLPLSPQQSPVSRKIYGTFYFYVLVVLLLGESKTFVYHYIKW